MTDELTLDMSRTYIYEGEEYILTGRTAQKDLNSSGRTSRRNRRKQQVETPQIDIVVEIKTAPKIKIHAPSVSSDETKWVNIRDLFMVENMLEEDEMEDNGVTDLLPLTDDDTDDFLSHLNLPETHNEDEE